LGTRKLRGKPCSCKKGYYDIPRKEWEEKMKKMKRFAEVFNETNL